MSRGRGRMMPATLMLVVAVLAAGPIVAQESASTDRVVYDAAWFARFAPRTAWEMVSRTPGFKPETGGGRRGLSVGNVLIDGEHAGAKSQGLAEILQRIPAKQVVRIELLRGAAVAGDPSGAAVLANVVRAASGGAGAWSLALEHARGNEVSPAGFVSWSARHGTTNYSIGANSRDSETDYPGGRRMTDAAGEVSSLGIDESPRDYTERAVNADVARTGAQGRLALTGKVARSRYRESSTLTTTAPDGVQLEVESNPYDGETRAWESGLAADRRLGGWEFELTALLNRSRTGIDSGSTRSQGESIADSATLQRLERDRGESIAHLDVARDLDAHRFEAGIESTLNTLDAHTRQWQDVGAGWAAVELPYANLQVRERRHETFAGYAWKPSGAWSLEAKLTAESSRLELSGDAERSVELVYWKPLLQVARLFGAGNQLQLRLFRDVGQLNFDDFVSAPSLADDVVNTGNPALRPQTTWRAEVAADLRFGDDSALNIRGYHTRLNDAVDLIPVGDPGLGAVAPANIGAGSITGIDLRCNLPMRVLMPGGTLGLAATMQESEVVDPVTREIRPLSDFQAARIRAEFRQDVVERRFAWGINYARGSAIRRYRPAEVDERRGAPALDVFIETSALEVLKVRLSAWSALGTTDQRERSFYVPDRGGALSSAEIGERDPLNRWMLTLSGNF